MHALNETGKQPRHCNVQYMQTRHKRITRILKKYPIRTMFTYNYRFQAECSK